MTKALTFEERQIIERMLKGRATQTSIAKAISHSQQCVSREIKEHSVNNVYFAEYAQFIADKNLQKQRDHFSVYRYDEEQLKLVKHYLRLGWSPKAIAASEDVEVSFATIYRWVKRGLINASDLPRKGKKNKKKEQKKLTDIAKKTEALIIDLAL